MSEAVFRFRGESQESCGTVYTARWWLEEAQCERVYDVMVREALEQGLAMWKTRNVCLQGAADREKDGMRRSEGADGRGG